MKTHDQNPKAGPAPAVQPVAGILVNVVLRRLAEERAEKRDEET